ncbi:peptidase M4 family protein [Virgibacillus sp. MSP4-1]|uniref:M4 family metallopeptidase n=1 Tax=Virgibacillus sp. MSP4-1 TaxID=2700081 RepID=UPI0005C4BFDC|nr:M4 family metallopeptidase [Virgibacillus sp. MSP4-1]QHS23334.1 peptidase M4 family protein [Virgibacillus sp. MSP4-1]
MKKRFALPIILSSAVVLGSANSVLAQPQNSPETAKTESGTVWNQNANVPLFVEEKLAEKQKGSSSQHALNYLAENEKKLGINNPKKNFKVKNVQKDQLGMTHVRFQQTEKDVPVEGTEIIVHFNKQNEVVAVNGRHNKAVKNADVDTNADLTESEAVTIAKSAVNAPESLTYKPTSELVVYTFKGQNTLSYKVNLNFLGDQPGNWFVFVDANTGEIVDQYNALLHTDDMKKKAINGIGQGVHGEKRTLHATKETQSGQESVFKLYDETHQNLEGIYTFDHNTGELFENSSNAWVSDYASPAVDAHYNSEKVYDYYLNEHDRNSLDGEGMPIISYVHFGENYNNAFWNGRFMTYGDGDGEFMVPLSAGLDVAAHEMTHGVITHSANLNYRNQSGALNESFADVFGALIDADDWEVGEDIMGSEAKESGRISLRSLSNPDKYPVSDDVAPFGDGQYPEHMNEFYDLPLDIDNGGVHINSSITNHAAYLIGEQLGKDKLGHIYYRALTAYLTPTSNFSDARKAIVQSAEDLYGESSEEVTAVKDGFDQVGIY